MSVLKHVLLVCVLKHVLKHDNLDQIEVSSFGHVFDKQFLCLKHILQNIVFSEPW